MTDEHIREFLTDSLALWRVEGSVEAGEAPVVAVVRTNDGTTVRIERKSAPFRWLVHAERPRPCASMAGVLNTLRSALGVERGSPIRVTPAPPLQE